MKLSSADFETPNAWKIRASMAMTMSLASLKTAFDTILSAGTTPEIDAKMQAVQDAHRELLFAVQDEWLDEESIERIRRGMVV